MNSRSKKTQDNKSKSNDSKKAGSGSGPATDKDVIVLNDSNFDENVLSSKDIWFVEFYAPWCGHCKALEPEWNEVATRFKGKVKFAKVDATTENQLSNRFDIQSYPTILYWNYGEGKQAMNYGKYEQARDAAAISTFANNLLDKADIQPEVHQLTRQSVYDNECKGMVICVMTFLPNIYDSSAV